MTITLDRIALEDVSREPQKLAAWILGQIAYQHGKVPIEEIAYALGITEIRREQLTNLEGTLITTAERDCGAILVNSTSSPQRGRYTIGHELGHYLNPYHAGAGDKARSCSKQDLSANFVMGADVHRKQEVEANRFAIEILAPRVRCRGFIGPEPDIREILRMRQEFDISREAAARRYAELHDEPIAVAFSKDNRLTYSVRSQSCPPLSVRKNELLSLPPAPKDGGAVTEMSHTAPDDWADRFRGEIAIQTLFQKEGFALTLLRFMPEDDEEPEIEDTFQRFSAFSTARS
jgi:Zn-dependent peptidase ImmA (M78 family)